MNIDEIKNNIKDVEIRSVSEIRADVETGIIKGYAIVFNSESVDLGGFTEVIKKEAASKEFILSQDIVMLYNHNEDHGILARYRPNVKSSLKVDVDDYGVYFEFKAKKKDMGIVEDIAIGDLTACSFAFRIAPDGEEFYEDVKTGKIIRYIKKFIAIRDMSIVAHPAYQATEVSLRNFDKFKTELEEKKKVKEEEERKIKEEEERKILLDLKKYSNKFKKYII